MTLCFAYFLLAVVILVVSTIRNSFLKTIISERNELSHVKWDIKLNLYHIIPMYNSTYSPTILFQHSNISTTQPIILCGYKPDYIHDTTMHNIQ